MTVDKQEKTAPTAENLAKSLRAMRRSAGRHMATRGGMMWSVVLDDIRIGYLTDAADLIERLMSELEEWRSVFGHLGATPDDCGNAVYESSKSKIEALEMALSAERAQRITLQHHAADLARRVDELERSLDGIAGVLDLDHGAGPEQIMGVLRGVE